jgi:hypothetical protein
MTSINLPNEAKYMDQGKPDVLECYAAVRNGEIEVIIRNESNAKKISE